MKNLSKALSLLVFALAIALSPGFVLKKTKVAHPTSESYYYVIVLEHYSDYNKKYVSGINYYSSSCGRNWEVEINARKAFEKHLSAKYKEGRYNDSTTGGILFGYSEKVISKSKAQEKINEFVSRTGKNNCVNTLFTYSCE